MLRIRCPHCGERDESEFRYRGDASQSRPDADAGLDVFTAYVYERSNERGWHLEWWLHVGGCRMLLKLARHTLTHDIAAIVAPGDALVLPADPER